MNPCHPALPNVFFPITSFYFRQKSFFKHFFGYLGPMPILTQLDLQAVGKVPVSTFASALVNPGRGG